METNCKQIKAEYELLQAHVAEFSLVVESIRAEDKDGKPVDRERLQKAKMEKKRLSAARDVLREKLFISVRGVRELIGAENVYGPEEIQNAFGFAVKNIPPIPYRRADLEKAKQLGEMLVLRVSVDGEGNPMTMKRMNEIMAGRMDAAEGKLLYSQKEQGKAGLQDDCWYENEAFFTSMPLKMEWKLVSKEFVADSTGKDYVGQTRVLRDHLQQIGALTPEEATGCSDRVLEQLFELMKTDWKKAAGMLVDLGVNKNHRRAPVEILYDWLLRFKNRQERGILEGKYDWSCALSSLGFLVAIGSADSPGVGVIRWLPGNPYVSVGVCSSR